MSGLGRWTPDPPDPGPFRFGERPKRLEVVSRRRIVRPGPDGPEEVGQVVRRYVGGALLEEDRRNKGATGPPKGQ